MVHSTSLRVCPHWSSFLFIELHGRPFPGCWHSPLYCTHNAPHQIHTSPHTIADIMEPTRISVPGLTSISHTGENGSVQLKSWVAINKRFAPTEYKPLDDSPMMFIEKDGFYCPDYGSHTTDNTHDMELKPGGEDSEISRNAHTPLSPFFSRHLAKVVVDQAAFQNLSVIPGQCRLESIHFPDEHAPLSPPASTMNEGNGNENPNSRNYEPRKSIFTFVVEDPKGLSVYPRHNAFTRANAYFNRMLNDDPL
jgi:hypothetical protein